MVDEKVTRVEKKWKLKGTTTLVKYFVNQKIVKVQIFNNLSDKLTS